MGDDVRTDAELLTASARGDEAAFGVLVRRYVRAATLLASQVLGSRSVAEDVVQDAFLVIYQKARTYDATRPFGPWCFGIVRRLAINRRARDQRRSRLLRFWHRLALSEDARRDEETALVAHLDSAKTTQALDTLPPMQRACFELVTVRGLSNREVAAMHGISESTVRQHVFRARAALRGLVGGSLEGNRDD